MVYILLDYQFMKRQKKPLDLLLKSKLSLLQSVVGFITLMVMLSCVVEDDTGYTDPREKFLGTWNVSDQAARLNYQVNIANDPAQSAQVILYNFADMGASAKGLVVGSKIILDKQDVGNGFFANGTGTFISSNKLEFAFALDDGIDLEQRVAVYSK